MLKSISFFKGIEKVNVFNWSSSNSLNGNINVSNSRDLNPQAPQDSRQLKSMKSANRTQWPWSVQSSHFLNSSTQPWNRISFSLEKVLSWRFSMHKAACLGCSLSWGLGPWISQSYFLRKSERFYLKLRKNIKCWVSVLKVESIKMFEKV